MATTRMIAVGVFAAAGLGALCYVAALRPALEKTDVSKEFQREAAPPPIVRLDTEASAANPRRPGDPTDALPGAVIAYEPTLDDGLLRAALADLSSDDLYQDWLFESGLLHRGIVIIDKVAQGFPTRQLLRFMTLDGPVPVLEREEGFLLNPVGHARYDMIIAVIDSLDPDSAADVYVEFEPALELAYRELGYTEGSFSTVLEAAIVELLAAPTIESEIALIRTSAGWEYARPDLESLSPAQKQLIRMGPDNTRIIQAKLREFALALDINIDEDSPPENRLLGQELPE